MANFLSCQENKGHLKSTKPKQDKKLLSILIMSKVKRQSNSKSNRKKKQGVERT